MTEKSCSLHGPGSRGSQEEAGINYNLHSPVGNDLLPPTVQSTATRPNHTTL